MSTSEILKQQEPHKVESMKGVNVRALLLFLMSYGASLTLWESHGIVSRELSILKPLSKIYSYILVLTYGGVKDLKYRELLPRNTKPLANKYNCNLCYLLLTPFKLRRFTKLFRVTLSRTVQLYGCCMGILLKLICNVRLILRQGYQFTLTAKRNHWAISYVIGTILELLGYWLADYIIVTSTSQREYIIKRYKVNEKKVVVIPNWVDTEKFKPTDTPKERGRIIFVGRLEYEKNVLSLIEAIKNIDGVKLYIVGDGSLRRIIENKIKSEGIKNVVLMGVIPNEKLPEELNKSEIFVLPSLWEGHPKALLEAMACGLPVIGTDVEGIHELIKHGYNGLLCKPDPKSIREAILTLLNNPKLREELGKNARKFVVENFSFEKIIRKELALHLWLIKQYERRKRK